LRALPAPLALAFALLAGCGGDNPACIFTSVGCQGGSGPGLGAAASLPSDGQLILSALPAIQRTAPSGTMTSSTTPIAVLFSESMSPATTAAKIELVRLDPGGFPVATVPSAQTLVGEGRMLVLLPAAALVPGDYAVRIASGASLLDLTGQKVALGAGAQLTTFQVGSADPAVPAVVATFPQEGDVVSTTTSIVVVFDRRIAAATITAASFDVQVDGAPPAFDPAPTSLTVQTSFLPIKDTRVYTYRSVDGDGVPASLGIDAAVELALSPTGQKIEDEDGGELAETHLAFTTQSLEAPLAAAILSTPSDGIGIANLTAGADALQLQIDLAAGEPGDELLVTLFGDSFDAEPQLFALGRIVDVAGAAPITAVPIALAELDLAPTPGTARFADGTVAFAFAVRRGTQTTALRLLDADPVGTGIQDPLLDTLAPTIEEFLIPGAGSTALFRSDLRDLVVSGRASEPLRSVEVTSALGTNGTLPAVVGATADGLFIAAPVPVGQVEDGAAVAFDLVAYDPVLNASPVLSSVFEQKGGVGATAVPFVAGDTIDVEVVDAVTLAPIVGARVYTHDDAGDGVSFPLRDAGSTGALGDVALASSPAPAAGTILTVDADGYDLFTFHRVASRRISVPLAPTGPGLALVGGVLTTSSPFAQLTLGLLQKKFDDSRRPAEMVPTFVGDVCITDPFGALPPSCPFGPESVRAQRLGALSFLAGNFKLTAATFSASTLLQAFDLSIPRPPTAVGLHDEVALDLAFLLNEPGLDATELPIGVDPTQFSVLFATDLDTGALVGDPETTGDPFVSVSALVPGVPGATTVGLGLAFNQGGGLWNVRAAYPGAVSPTGFFGAGGAVDTDLFLRVEARDAAGNRTGQRPRLSTLETLPLPFTLFAPAVPTVSSPADGGATGGAAFNVEFTNAIVDLAGEPGLYVVTLADGLGRRWRLVLPDPPNGATTLVHVPDLAAVGALPGTPLADGVLSCWVEAFAWPGLDTGAFLLSDVAREQDLFSAAAPITFSLP
jgi:hypothetical protein